MKIEWILEENCFGGEQADLISAALDAGHKINFDIPDSIDHTDFRIIRGSTDFVDRYSAIFLEFDPFCICSNLKFYDCTHYYTKNNYDKLLNSDCVWIPWKNLNEDLFDFFKTDRLFIRPNSGKKIFTGTTVGYKWFDKELEVIQSLPSTKGLTPETLVLVSSCKDIVKEARFLVGPDGIIDGSWYNGDGNNLELKQMSDFANEFSFNKIVIDPSTGGFVWEDFFTIDVAQTEKFGLQVVEINSFSSSGLYNMHTPTIIKNIEEYIKYIMDCDIERDYTKEDARKQI